VELYSSCSPGPLNEEEKQIEFICRRKRKSGEPIPLLYLRGEWGGDSRDGFIAYMAGGKGEGIKWGLEK